MRIAKTCKPALLTLSMLIPVSYAAAQTPAQPVRPSTAAARASAQTAKPLTVIVELDLRRLSISRANATIIIEDVTYLGGVAPTISKKKLKGISGGKIVTTRLTIANPDPNISYNVRVDIDVDNDGKRSTGDYWTDTMIGIDTAKSPAKVRVDQELKRLRYCW